MALMVDAQSTVVAIVRRVDAERRAIAQPILVGSARNRVAISAARRASATTGTAR
jgi:hypothetical protein